MVIKRNNAKQIAFRVEPAIADVWARFVEDSLIPHRAHLTCAVLLYLWAGAEQRSAVQRSYARFQRDQRIEPPAELAVGPRILPASELELLAAYRNACDKAREEAIAKLLSPGEDALREHPHPLGGSRPAP